MRTIAEYDNSMCDVDECCRQDIAHLPLANIIESELEILVDQKSRSPLCMCRKTGGSKRVLTHVCGGSSRGVVCSSPTLGMGPTEKHATSYLAVRTQLS